MSVVDHEYSFWIISFFQKRNIDKLENHICGLQTAINNGIDNVCNNQQRMSNDLRLLAGNTSYKPVIAYKIIHYTWEQSYSMQQEFENALSDGYEPAGYLCQNSIKGGLFLFVKRAK